MGIAEVLLAIFVVLKLLGYPAAMAIGWGTLVMWYGAFYIFLALFALLLVFWSNR